MSHSLGEGSHETEGPTMARVRSLQKGLQKVRVHSSEVDCAYQIVTGEGGKTYLHLATFGSDQRQSLPTTSQTIQLDRDVAAKLVTVLRRSSRELLADLQGVTRKEGTRKLRWIARHC